MSKPRDGASTLEIPEISQVTESETDDCNGEETLHDVQIVGVSRLMKYRSCMRCKARVEPCDAPFGRCSREDCAMLQRYEACSSQLSSQLKVTSKDKPCLTVFCYGKLLMELVGQESADNVSEENLLLVPMLPWIKINEQNVITSYSM